MVPFTLETDDFPPNYLPVQSRGPGGEPGGGAGGASLTAFGGRREAIQVFGRQ